MGGRVMSYKIENVFSLTGGGSVEVGVKPTDRDGFRYAPPGQNGALIVPVLFSRGGNAPRMRNGLLVEGKPEGGFKGSPHFIQGRGSWQGALLYIDVKEDLRFPSHVGVHFPISNAYAGAEVVSGCWFQCGGRRSIKQNQWVSFPSDFTSAIIADTGGEKVRYIKVCWRYGGMKVEAPNVKEMGRMLVDRARATQRPSHSMLLWTVRNLEAIGAGNMWPGDLAKKLNDLSF